MRCPRCHYDDTKVTNSRDIDDNTVIRRRRECLQCGMRFTTFEKIGLTELIVVKKDNTREIYSREKLKRAIMLAFAKRTTADPTLINDVISDLELQWIEKGNEVTSDQIGKDVVNALKSIDVVAYLRFASVYQAFEDIDDFKNFIS